MNLSIFCIAFILFTTNITAANSKDWWKEAVFYQIYMPSFKDSNGDGYSDFAGMTEQLEYLQNLGVKGIWLTPFLKSPKVDNGYDIADYYNVDPVYGSLDDFKHFLDEAHRRDIKVIMDMVVNHSSTHSEWFQQARKSHQSPYRDYYIWRDQPNNWESFFGGPAWTFDSVAGQYYYHKFDRQMADLNWTSPAQIKEIQEVLRFWLELGIDGFRMDVINFLTTDEVFTDNPVVEGKQLHQFDMDKPGVIQAMRIIKQTVNEYEDRFVVGEIGSDKLEILSRYQSGDLMDVVFNFNFGSIPSFSTERLFDELQAMDEMMPGYPTLFFGSHDNPRLMSRLANDNHDRALALAALMLTAKGIPFIYYGEEIGMQNIEAQHIDEIIDVQGRIQYELAVEAGSSPSEALEKANKHNRDKSRSPMQWNDDKNAGFTSGEPWIGLHKNYRERHVQQMQQDTNSMLHKYIKLIKLRNNSHILHYGDFTMLDHQDQRIAFTRTYKGNNVSVVINFGDVHKMTLPENANIMMGSPMLETNDFIIYAH